MCVAGDDHRRDLATRRLANGDDGIEPRLSPRQPIVDQSQIRGPSLEPRTARGPNAAGTADFVAPARKQRDQTFSHQLVVIDDQNARLWPRLRRPERRRAFFSASTERKRERKHAAATEPR